MALTWPASLRPSEMSWGIVNNSRAFTSSLSNAQQIVGYPGAYWQCTLTFGLLTRAQERELSSFLGRLDGMFGTFNLPDFTRYRKVSIGALSVVSGFAQARSMIIAGAPASSPVFSAGDYITIAGEMFEVTDPASSNAQGQATVLLNKRIRKTLTAGAAVEYMNPYSEMRMTSDTWSMTRRPVVANGSYQFREAF
ncbi:hypothetical protein C4C37_13485 [Pseudomonas amygdali pv. lachrymans]|uniref:Prophage PSSB64-02 n=2 Tax=Pseudomonas amygdali pv. lachrymans TaxID=53707 RepID=A0ABR5KZJ2_PSEAV|nr:MULTISPECIES: hypothetical protein [Pseudomonas syringae group genomosp. 2]MDU8420217.1 hypothetical protein [Pseudomonas syringae]AXH56320.1 hypothetical protein PLA107_014115 [Pseudomonas amygdali pv. lachrymans str. M301315]KPC20414.1 Uncharacterized protein AC499_2121 [Pseudomonas amygdali pv. lachrymans]PWD04069.1 hypothetical protein CX658_03705 [Pseudomonas amygdali pv. lachrymans]QOI04614.1 hypothetical protein D5S10_12455 [Pseudomonas savastanoi]